MHRYESLIKKILNDMENMLVTIEEIEEFERLVN